MEAEVLYKEIDEFISHADKSSFALANFSKLINDYRTVDSSVHNDNIDKDLRIVEASVYYIKANKKRASALPLIEQLIVYLLVNQINEYETYIDRLMFGLADGCGIFSGHSLAKSVYKMVKELEKKFKGQASANVLQVSFDKYFSRFC